MRVFIGTSSFSSYRAFLIMLPMIWRMAFHVSLLFFMVSDRF